MSRKKILFLDGTAGFYPTRLEDKPCGGILTSLTLIPQYLAKCGYDITVCSVWDIPESVNGVRYIRYIDRDLNGEQFDVVVFNRNLMSHILVDYFKSAKKVWWLHDIVDYKYLEDDSFKAMDMIVSLSDYCSESYKEFYDIEVGKFRKITNGVDKSIFYPDPSIRDSNLFVCASAPVKGYYPLEFTFANLKRINPNVRLVMYSSQSLHDKDNGKAIDEQLNRYKLLGIDVKEPIGQKELAKVFREARALLMPNHYPEICSNLILQAQACGLPVITSNIGSAPEFIKHKQSGLLTKRYPHDMFLWWADFARLTVELQMEDKLFQTINRNSSVDVKSWDDVGAEWMILMEGL